MNNRIAEAVEDLKDYIGYMKEEGVEEMELDRENLKSPPNVTAASATTPDVEEESVEAPNLEDIPGDRNEALARIEERIAECKACPLWTTRTNTVPGQGCLDPDLMFIGEAPGRDEDLQGVPFVGRAGKLLSRLITRMGYTREEVFIGNIAKCRPTEDYAMVRDRAPSKDEMAACIHFLKDQIRIIRPKVIVALGNTALDGLFGFRGITKRRGHWLEYEGIPTMPTYHPSYLLRGGGDQGKRFWEVWEDMLLIFQELGKEPPPEK